MHRYPFQGRATYAQILSCVHVSSKETDPLQHIPREINQSAITDDLARCVTSTSAAMVLSYE